MYEKYMIQAINEAKIAFLEGEIPVGAVLVHDSEIIATSHNTRMQDKSPIGHAEINLLTKAGKTIGDWRLCDCTLYVTLLPCPMCASAINQCRIKKVVCGTVPNNVDYSLIYSLLNNENYGKKVEIITGVLEDECSLLLKKFFAEKRS